MSSDSEDKKPVWSDGDSMSKVGLSVLSSIPTFRGAKDEHAKRFMKDFEEALDLANLTSDKHRKYYFKTKLRGLPAEWYETIRDDDEYKSWDAVKNSFLRQFDKTTLRPKDIIMRLMSIRQNTQEDESIQSLSIRITQLFNEYKQTMKADLKREEKVEYFIEALFPSYKEQLNNQYQNADGTCYNECTFDEVLATALKLERNARSYEEDVQRLPGGLAQLKINAVHKAVNPSTHVNVSRKGEVSSRKPTVEAANGKDMENQNADDIKKMQKEQLIIKDQLAAVSNALNNFGEQMRGMRSSIEHLRNERVHYPATTNPMYSHRFRGQGGPYNNSGDVRNSYIKRYDDPRVYNTQRANDGRLQNACFKCGKIGHYANACRSQVDSERVASQGLKQQISVNQPVQNEQLSGQGGCLPQSNLRNAGSGDQNSTASGARTGPVTRSKAAANHVSIINHARNDMNYNAHLMTMTGQIGSTKLTNIVFDNGAAVSCLNAQAFNRLDPSIKSKLRRCDKEKQLTNATGGAMTLLGELDITIDLEGPGCVTSFQNMSVVVVNNLQSDMLFGADILTKEKYKSYKVDLNQQRIVFEDQNGQQESVTFNQEPEEELKEKPIPVFMLKKTRVPANSSLVTYGVHQIFSHINGKHAVFNGSDQSLHFNVHAEDTLFITQHDSRVPVILTNETDLPYTIKEGALIGSCEAIMDIASIGQQQTSVADGKIKRSSVTFNINNVDCQIADEVESGIQNIKQYDLSTIESIDISTKEKLRAMLMNHAHVFSDRPYGSVATGLMEHSIELTDPSVKPIKHYGYRVSPAVATELMKSVDEMHKLGVIEESQSPWASPVLLVPKKDGTQRFCTDFRRLNAVTKSDVFPLPRIDDIMDKLGSCQFFTSIDLKHAFWQIPMKLEDKEKTAFICGHKLWQYRQMAFGLKNSPATFQRCISKAIGENGFSLAYLDDIIIFSATVEDHLMHIESILKCLARHNLNAKINKCEFFKTSLTFLGHIVSRDGISVCPDKVAAVKKFPAPTNMKELRSFLGLANYYRRFIKDYSKITCVLTRLLQKNVEYKWTAECQSAFDELKDRLTQAPVLAFADYSLQFILTTDACESGIGGVLSQCFDTVEKPVMFLSRTLNQHEKNYATTHKECLAIVWCIKQCEHYLMANKFIVRTDHNALKWLMNVKDHNGRLMRWALTLMEYDFEIQHVKGKTNFVADALSRAPVNMVVTVNEEKKSGDAENSLTSETAELIAGHKLDVIRQMQLEDEELIPIILYLTDGTLPEDGKHAESLVHKTLNKYVLVDGVLYHLWQQSNALTHPRVEMVQQLVIPKCLRKEILFACHEDLFSGHSGIKKTYERLRNRFYWDNMYKDAVEHVQSCLDCEMKKFPANTGTTVPVSLTHKSVPEPCQDWCVDLCGPFPKSHKGNKYAVIFMDRFSRFPEAFGIPDKKAETVAKVLVEQIVCRYGCPRTLLSDRGGEFLSDLSQETYRLMNIQKLNTSGYRPQTNGMVEKFNHTLVQSISQYITSDQRDWDEFLPFACFQYRSSKNETTNETPYYLLFYREMKMPLDRVYSKDEEFQSAEEYLREAKLRFRAAKEIFIRQREAIEEEKKHFNDSIRKTVNFEIGEVVLILKRYVKRGQVKKLTHMWKGPYVVIQKFPSGINYEVQLLMNGKDRHVVHASNMKVYTEPHRTHLSKQLQSSEDEEEQQEFEVEAILDKRQENGQLYYLVKWKNFDSSANSWEPINNLIHCRDIIKEFEQRKKKSEEKAESTHL